MAEKIQLGISLNSRDAEKALDKLGSSMKALAGAAAAVFAGKQVVDFFSAGVDAAVAQEKAMARLGQQMKLTGSFSTGAMNDFKKFADEMERSTRFGDDLVLSQLSVAKSFGISNDQAKKLVTAATELSAVTGDSLESSVEQLGKTFQGVAGKSPALKNALKGISEEGLKAGRGLDAVLTRFKGSAAAELDTFSGAVLQTGNAFGNLQEAFGAILVDNPAVVQAIKGVGKAFNVIEDFVSRNSDGLKKVIGDLALGFLEQLPAMLTGLDILTRGFGELKTFDIKSVFDGMATAIGFVTDEILLLARGFTELKLLMTAPIDTFMAKDLAELKKARPDLAGYINTLEEIDRRRLENQSNTGDIIAGAPVKGSGGLFSSLAVEIQNAIIAGRKAQTQGPAAPGAGDGGGGGEGNGGEYKYKSSGPMGPDVKNANYLDLLEARLTNQMTWDKAGLSLATSFGANLGGGKDGARKFVAGVGGAIADVFAPGAGGAVASALEMLGQDPEAFRAAIDGFVKGIPEIIDNIILNIPYLVEALAANSGEIITALVSMTPRIAIALAQAMPTVAQALVSEVVEGIQYQMSKLLSGGATDFQNGIHDAGTAFKNSMYTAAHEFGNELISMAEQIVNAIVPGSSGGGSRDASDYVEELPGKLGLPGASLTGSMPRSSSRGGSTTDALLAQVIQLLKQPMTVNATATVRDQAFADIVLDLSRRNARLYA